MNTYHLRKRKQTDFTPENLSGEMQEDVPWKLWPKGRGNPILFKH